MDYPFSLEIRANYLATTIFEAAPTCFIVSPCILRFRVCTTSSVWLVKSYLGACPIDVTIIYGLNKCPIGVRACTGINLHDATDM